MVAGKSTPISMFHVVDPNKLEEPFVITGHYIDSDFWGMREEHNMLKVFLNEGFGGPILKRRLLLLSMQLLHYSAARVQG